MRYICSCFHGQRDGRHGNERRSGVVDYFSDEAVLTDLQIIGCIDQVFLRSEERKWSRSVFYFMEHLVRLSGLVNFNF